MENKTNVIICDLDGTLCLFEKEDKNHPHYRNPYDAGRCENDKLNDVVYSILQHYHVILVSGREDKFRNETIRFLDKHQVHYIDLYMRKSGDYRKDSLVKREIYEQHIKDKYNVLFVLDDRDQVVRMWRSEGLVCLQVAEGNF